MNFIQNNTMQNSDINYQIFLDDVRRKTIEIASNIQSATDNNTTVFKIRGVDFSRIEIENNYGELIYKIANEEVPFEWDGIHNFPIRDFSKATIKLGHLCQNTDSNYIHYPLMDLDLFIELLAEKGIPSYIDFEENIFHYNESLKQEKNI